MSDKKERYNINDSYRSFLWIPNSSLRHLTHVKKHPVHISVQPTFQRDKNTRPYSLRWRLVGDHPWRGTHDSQSDSPNDRGCEGERIRVYTFSYFVWIRGMGEDEGGRGWRIGKGKIFPFVSAREGVHNNRCVEIIATLRLTIANLHAWPRSTSWGGPRL